MLISDGQLVSYNHVKDMLQELCPAKGALAEVVPAAGKQGLFIVDTTGALQMYAGASFPESRVTLAQKRDVQTGIDPLSVILEQSAEQKAAQDAQAAERARLKRQMMAKLGGFV